MLSSIPQLSSTLSGAQRQTGRKYKFHQRYPRITRTDLRTGYCRVECPPLHIAVFFVSVKLQWRRYPTVTFFSQEEKVRIDARSYFIIAIYMEVDFKGCVQRCTFYKQYYGWCKFYIPSTLLPSARNLNFYISSASCIFTTRKSPTSFINQLPKLLSHELGH